MRQQNRYDTNIMLADADGDGVADERDNRLDDANPDQADGDGDGVGDACDCACIGDVSGDGQIDLSDLGCSRSLSIILLEAGSPFIVSDTPGHCGDINGDWQLDLEDLQLLVDILLQAGSPFIAPCEGL